MTNTESRTHNLGEEELEEYKEAFMHFDRDGSGAISVQEMECVMKNLGHNPSEKELEEMISQHDLDNSGQIEFNEFCLMMSQTKRDTDQELRDAFKMFDKDESGYISADELRQVMIQLGQHLDDDEVNAMIEEADCDGDGQINYQEFVAMMHTKQHDDC